MSKSKKSRRVTTRAYGDIPGLVKLPAGDQPELECGPVPSHSCLAFIARMQQDHEGWQRRRADIKGWKYNEATGMAEKPVKRKPSASLKKANAVPVNAAAMAVA